MQLITDRNLESADPVLALRWCLDRSEVEKLRASKAKDIHLLVIVVYEGGFSEDRYLVKLDDVMMFVNFRKPGAHTILAVVLRNMTPKGGESIMKKYDRFRYNINLTRNLPGNGGPAFSEYAPETYSEYWTEIQTELEVAVPKEHFPKEPPEFLRKLVNFRSEYEATDPCMFRRRLLALTFKLPIWAAAAILIVSYRFVVATLLSVLGFREVDWSAILHPNEKQTFEVWNLTSFKNNWFWVNKDGKFRPDWFILFHPLSVLGLIALLRQGVFAFVSKHIMAVSIISLLIMIFALTGTWIVQKLMANYEKRQEYEGSKEYEDELARKRDEQYNTLYQMVGCKTTPMVASLSEIPKDRRTVKLRFLNLKRKVCQPYAQ